MSEKLSFYRESQPHEGTACGKWFFYNEALMGSPPPVDTRMSTMPAPRFRVPSIGLFSVHLVSTSSGYSQTSCATRWDTCDASVCSWRQMFLRIRPCFLVREKYLWMCASSARLPGVVCLAGILADVGVPDEKPGKVVCIRYTLLLQIFSAEGAAHVLCR